MPRLPFSVPFCGFAGTNFINCFASVYLYLEDRTLKSGRTAYCNVWENGPCNKCGNCAAKPQALQEKYFFLFDTVCGRSSLRLRFEEAPTETDRLINERDDDDGGAADNIDFLFGFAGYRYRAVTDAAVFRDEAAASVSRNNPMIAKLKGSCVPFAVITGFEGDRLLCPDFKCAQKSPDPEISYDSIDALYLIGEKTAPKYTLADGLKRIELVMDTNLREGLWDKCMKKIGTYGPDSLGQDNPAGRKKRMKRLAEMMWHTFNCHNFAEVFRTYLPDSENKTVYDNLPDVKWLADPKLHDLLHTISWRYGYTHDLAWSIIGLEECLNWDDWKSMYYGDMLEVILLKLKENDEAVLACIRRIAEALSEN